MAVKQTGKEAKPQSVQPERSTARGVSSSNVSLQTGRKNINHLDKSTILHLHRAIGNQGVQRLIQRQPNVSQPPTKIPTAQGPSTSTEADPLVAKIDSIQQTYKEHFAGFQTALDQLDVGSLAIVAELLQVDYTLMEELDSKLSEQTMTVEASPSAWSAKSRLAKFKKEFGIFLGRDVGLQQFRGEAIIGSYKVNPEALTDPIQYLRSEMTYVLRTVQSLNLILNYATQDEISSRDILYIATYFDAENGRPINIKFKVDVLIKMGVWQKLESKRKTARSGLEKNTYEHIFDLASRSGENSREFSDFTDVGTFDLKKAKGKLSRGLTDWAVTDDDAESVFKMLASAPPAGRNAIIHKLKHAGKLDRLLDNLPWAQAKQLHDTSDDPDVQKWLLPYFQGKGGGKSLSSMYEDNIMENIKEDNNVRGYLWTLLKGSHNALTGGFADTYSEAYDLSEHGLISDDKFWATSGAALARTAAVLVASTVTGGAASGFASGVGEAGLGMSEGMAGVFGNVVGGAAGNTAGLLTSDAMSMALLDQKGFSPGSSYLSGAFLGGGMGLVASAGQLAPRTPKGFTSEEFAAVHPWRARLAQAGNRLRASEQATAEIYAKHPWLNKLTQLTQGANAKGTQLGKGGSSPLGEIDEVPPSNTNQRDGAAPSTSERYNASSQLLRIKQLAIDKWTQNWGSGGRLVKVVPMGKAAELLSQGVRVRGYVTEEKFVLGCTPEEMEGILGLKSKTLKNGADVDNEVSFLAGLERAQCILVFGLLVIIHRIVILIVSKSPTNHDRLPFRDSG